MALRVAGVATLVCTAHGFRLSFPIQARIARSPTAVKSSATQAPARTEQRDLHRGDEASFDWHKKWYPVLSVVDSDPERTHAVQLLGKDLVVWRDKDGRWSCFDDRCPHRAAPLTEGRVEKDGSLLCAYHAWRFDADGKCLTIPQSDSGGKDEAQPKACLQGYPTQVAQDVIWVWGENGPDAGLESALRSPPLVPELDDAEGIKSGRVIPGAVVQRDLPYDWDTFMENVVDPAHVVVSHHGLMGNRNMAKPLSLKQSGADLNQDGFVLENYSPQFGAKKSIVTFVAPILAEIVTEQADGTLIKLVLYNIPTRPGWSRTINRTMTVYTADKKEKETLRSKLLKRISPIKFQPNEQRLWVQHLLSHLFVHQDLVLLHHQEKIMAAAGHRGPMWGRGVYTPTTSDRGVLTLRKWINKYAPAGPPWPTGSNASPPVREYDREVLQNVYQQHTKNCTTCKGALKRIQQCVQGAKAAAVGSLVWGILRAMRVVGTSANASSSVINLATARAILPGLLIALGSVRVVKTLESLTKMFYVYNYSHQDNP